MSDPGRLSTARMEPMSESIAKESRRPALSRMSEEELVDFAKRFCREKRIRTKKALWDSNSALHSLLRKWDLLDDVGLAHSKTASRAWKIYADEKLVAIARAFLTERKIDQREGLRKVDVSLYGALQRRNLLDEVGLANSNVKHRAWRTMADRELVGFTGEFIKVKKIGTRADLQKADGSLYDVVRRRNLLADLGLVDSRGKRRDWAKMNDAKLVDVARDFIRENMVSSRTKLKNIDSGLYDILWKRKLLDRTFALIERSAQQEAVDGVLGAIETFNK